MESPSEVRQSPPNQNGAPVISFETASSSSSPDMEIEKRFVEIYWSESDWCPTKTGDYKHGNNFQWRGDVQGNIQRNIFRNS